MARIKYASIVSSVSGSVGSATFQKSLYGDTLRNKPRPRRSGSVLQMTRRSTMMSIHAAWSALLDAERTQWNQFISYSSAKIRRDKNVLLTGHALFIQYNYMRVISNFPILTTPGYNIIPESYGYIELGYAAANDMNFFVGAESMDAGLWFNCMLSSPRKPSLSFQRQGLRYLPLLHTAGEDWNIYTQLMSMFGASYAIGDTVHYAIRFFSVLSPIVTGWSTGKAIVGDHT